MYDENRDDRYIYKSTYYTTDSYQQSVESFPQVSDSNLDQIIDIAFASTEFPIRLEFYEKLQATRGVCQYGTLLQLLAVQFMRRSMLQAYL